MYLQMFLTNLKKFKLHTNLVEINVINVQFENLIFK